MSRRSPATCPPSWDDYDPGRELTARLLAGGRSNLTCLLSQPGAASSLLICVANP
jgi:hypothetical protein